MPELNIDVFKNAFPLRDAIDPMAIKEQEMAVGTQLKVVGLANCLGVAFINDGFAIASHIGPFGGEKQNLIELIKEVCQYYVDVMRNKYNNNPNIILIRSREIGSRPLFHRAFIDALRANFPNVTLDVSNATSLLVDV